jgi:hypothetical protein
MAHSTLCNTETLRTGWQQCRVPIYTGGDLVAKFATNDIVSMRCSEYFSGICYLLLPSELGCSYLFENKKEIKKSTRQLVAILLV